MTAADFPIQNFYARPIKFNALYFSFAAFWAERATFFWEKVAPIYDNKWVHNPDHQKSKLLPPPAPRF